MKSHVRTAQSLIVLTGALCAATSARAAGTIEIDENRWVSVGAGMRAGFVTTEDGAANGSDDSKSFSLQSARIYVSGSASEKVKFTLNTECQGCVFGEDSGQAGAGGNIDVLDAIAQLEFSDHFNVWIGRMLTPADRIEMNGPYYGLSWNQFTVPLLPSDQNGMNGAGLLGRDDGVTVWGTVGKFQYAVGVFDGVDSVSGSPNQEDSVLFASRFAYNFLNMESNPGYYTSSTYYGGLGDIFTVGLSFQSQSDATGTIAEPADFSAVIVDVLYENAFEGGSALTIEGEYKMFDADMTDTAAANCGVYCLFDGDAYFATIAFLFGSDGWMKPQPYVRYTSNEPDSGADSDLTEVGLNLIINSHNARLNFNYTSGDANLSGYPGADVDTLSFGVQVQI